MAPDVDGLTEIVVHPDTVAAHQSIGWYIAPPEELEQFVAEEPEESEKLAIDSLPDDFPGYGALQEAGISTYTQLRAEENVTDIKGIGPSTAAKIAEALENE